VSGAGRIRKSYSAEFKLGAIQLVLEKGLKQSQVAQDLGIEAGMLSNWIRSYKKSKAEAFPGNGRMTAQEQRIRDLEAEVRQLKMEREILKKATAFFASHGR
jgi:transposase